MITTDVVIIGGGAAGLSTALRLANTLDVTVITKTPLGSGAATAWAQGGIAAAIGTDDSASLHVEDTERAGGGLNDHHIVEILANDAVSRIDELLAIGTTFDREDDGRLALGREAAHSRRRILHAGGDATGREILRALVATVRQSSIHVIEAVADDLIVENGCVVGVLTHASGEPDQSVAISARAVMLATGGSGRLYQYTTNPHEATADGCAIAARAGAHLVDLEFVQFHPTALAGAADPMPLLTEALRGEGARLIDAQGRGITDGLDSRGDLAPRDIVARAVYQAVADGRKAYLDARKVINLARHFPTISAIAKAAGYDPVHEPLPIAAAAHYHMGGVAVDDFGRSSVRGLWACGEVASTGAHGANRLASNSLLEAFVFAARAASDIIAHLPERRSGAAAFVVPERRSEISLSELKGATERLRAAMYAGVGVVRNARGMLDALAIFEDMESEFHGRSQALANQLLAARLITTAALTRGESRGSHFRSDAPIGSDDFAHRLYVHAIPSTSGKFAIDTISFTPALSAAM